MNIWLEEQLGESDVLVYKEEPIEFVTRKPVIMQLRLLLHILHFRKWFEQYGNSELQNSAKKL